MLEFYPAAVFPFKKQADEVLSCLEREGYHSLKTNYTEMSIEISWLHFHQIAVLNILRQCSKDFIVHALLLTLTQIEYTFGFIFKQRYW